MTVRNLKNSNKLPWLDEKVDQRSLLDMVTLWHNHHSISLTHTKYIYRKLQVIVLGMGKSFMMRFIRKMP
ncbi:hypothetical protein [Aliivibrio fischeri]|uniref:hypothetical protein n=1 Tax=Aliivibrio fischeri TaxID=668 RepID=UPI0018C6AE18|nr:hypothetical protein [Aliivibrio fischeri]